MAGIDTTGRSSSALTTVGFRRWSGQTRKVSGWRVLGIDIKTCSACGGAMRIIGSIEGPAEIEKILTHPDAKAAEPQAPKRPPCRAPPQRALFD